MRILILNSEYSPVGGGAGNASANLARLLVEAGREVTVVTSRFGSLPHREKSGNLTVVRIPAFRRKQDRSGALEQLIFMISASISTLSLVREFKPDAAIAFFGIPSGAVAFILKIFRGIPYLVSLRGGDVPGFRPYDFNAYHRIIGPLLRVVWRNAFAIIANSRGLRELALRFDSRYEIQVIPNGVELGLYKSGAHENAAPRLFSAGRIVHQKGLDLGMRALAGLKDLDWEWHIAGDGPQLNFLKLLARELSIDDRVHFLGWMERKELIEQYRWADLFLFPSRHEGMPNAVLEAMASGLPVIASRIAGNEELVVDGETGLLVASEDVNAFRSALRQLLTNAAQREAMGNASRRRVEEKYSWSDVARQYELILERIKN